MRLLHATARCPSRRLIVPLLWAGGALAMANGRAETVTIYRCTDDQGQLSLRDTPCKAGEKEQVQTMRKPVDPPPAPATAAPPVAAPRTPVTPATPQVVYIQPPRPVYECTTPDGTTYTSDTPEGNPRWVPLWTLDYPVASGYEQRGGYRAGVDVGGGSVRGRVEVGGGYRRGGGRPPLVAGGYPAGTWVRDVCNALPQQEVCDRLRDRRYELDRQYNSALQSERHAIDKEQRAIDARIANDCRNP